MLRWAVEPFLKHSAIRDVRVVIGESQSELAVGGSYNISKRTLFDVQVATVRNSSTANFGLNANGAGTAVSTGNPHPGGSQTGVYAGIQHLF